MVRCSWKHWCEKYVHTGGPGFYQTNCGLQPPQTVVFNRASHQKSPKIKGGGERVTGEYPKDNFLYLQLQRPHILRSWREAQHRLASALLIDQKEMGVGGGCLDHTRLEALHSLWCHWSCFFLLHKGMSSDRQSPCVANGWGAFSLCPPCELHVATIGFQSVNFLHIVTINHCQKLGWKSGGGIPTTMPFPSPCLASQKVGGLNLVA